jgi:hypothetical protein
MSCFIDWLISREGKNAITDYKVEGQQLFVPLRCIGMLRYPGCHSFICAKRLRVPFMWPQAKSGHIRSRVGFQR